ncbi:hypothetical protein KDA_41740 [Dictyobacter alpinus]|uniref:Response regulatory domain-containing protein n=1 Tax=Dictyobacter alpinus TaxID=2014873 RepID=A0A402BBM1_9CHLR|nr:response regulator [Dictyobacter alpinus]GCE28690.1 hypothetical protein KDA_41740 [Dictyobacter alpinus]
MHDYSAAHNPSDRDSTPIIMEVVEPVHLADGGHKRNYSILVVEDDPTLAALEADTLTTLGYTVVSVHSGEHAITSLHSVVPDLVVLDLELTGEIHGWDVLQALRSIAPIIPVLITSSSVTSARQYMRDRGETRLTLDHLPKPYPLQALLKRIQRMLPISPTH